MSQQMEVLERLLKFYSKRYNGAELDKKMADSVQDLIDSADISLAAGNKFFAENDINEKLKAKKAPTYTSDPCGHGGGYGRSHC